MALVKYGAGIIQASGSIGGTTYARNRFGNYMRARTMPVNPNSPSQDDIRSSMSSLGLAWQETLDSDQRTAWNTFAGSVSEMNKLGESVYITGFNQFLKANILRLMTGDSLIADGPTVLAKPAQDPTLAVAAVAGSGELEITFDDAADWNSETDARMLIFMGEPQSPTRNFFAGPWKYAGKIDTGATSPDTIDAPYTLVEGQKIWIYARVQMGDGRVSGKFRSNTIVSAAT